MRAPGINAFARPVRLLGGGREGGRSRRGRAVLTPQARQASVLFSAWELSDQAAAWCLAEAGLRPADLDRVGYAYAYAPALAEPADALGLDDPWDHLRPQRASKARNYVG